MSVTITAAVHDTVNATATTSVDATQAVASGWPDATNTGPTGTLANTSGRNITTNGVTIQNENITGTLNITASNVTVKNCKVDGGGNFWAINSENAINVTVLDCEIFNATQLGGTGVNMRDGTVQRCNIHNVENGIECGGGGADQSVLKDNYIHDLVTGNPAGHFDGISCHSNGNILITHNHIEGWDTSCVFMQNFAGNVSNIITDGNRLIARDSNNKPPYTVFSDGRQSGGAVSGNRFTNNIMQMGVFGYGSIDNNVVVWTGNVDYFTGQPVNP